MSFVLLWCRRSAAILIAAMVLPAVAQNWDAYLEEIKTQNPACKEANLRVAAAEAAVSAAGVLPNPNVQVGVFAQSVETRVGPQEYSVQLSQAVPWRGKLKLREARARRQADKARAMRDMVVLEKTSAFRKTMADYFYLGKALALTRDHLELLDSLEGTVTRRYENNAASYNDLIRIQIEKDQLTDRLATQQASAQPLRAALNVLLGRPMAQSLPFPEALPRYDMPQTVSAQSLAETLAGQHPVLAKLQHQADADRLSVALAAKARRPDFKFGLSWIQTGDAIQPGLQDSGKDPILLSVGLDLPVWRKKNRALVESATASLQATEQQRTAVQEDLTAHLQTTLFQLDDARRKMALYRDQVIPKAEESLNVMIGAFETGASTYLELIDAEKSLLEFRLALSQAQANCVKAIAAIEAATGTLPFPEIAKGGRRD